MSVGIIPLMTESALWKYLNRIMHQHWVADRIENKVGTGLPDIAYHLAPNQHRKGRHGWIELKTGRIITTQSGVFDQFSKVRLNHPLSARQARWIATRGKMTDSVFVMIGLEPVKTYVLLSWRDVEQIVIKGGMGAQPFNLAPYTAVWGNRIPPDALSAVLGGHGVERRASGLPLEST